MRRAWGKEQRDIRLRILDCGCWMLDTRCWMPETGCPIPDAGCGSFDFGLRIGEAKSREHGAK
ncbi:MAG: hypothetical protein QNJ58_23045, partial [Desulfobacterales bacterium]|nr:hypothetical protein [Desulfobacterales bacterium]